MPLLFKERNEMKKLIFDKKGKLLNGKMTPLKDLTMEYFDASPYASVVCAIFEQKGIIEPTMADLFEAFHEVAKVDNKINQRKLK